MPTPAVYSFTRYLSAKRTVDDRALNRHVWNSLRSALAAYTPLNPPLTVFEIGAGIGTMVERVLEAHLLPACRYLLLDADSTNMQAAARRLAAWAEQRSGTTTAAASASPLALPPLAAFQIAAPAIPAVDVFTYAHDLFAFLADAGPTPAVDLLVAHAFIDLVDVPSTLQRLTAILRPGALVYLTINFDGDTILQPAIDPPFDDQIEQLYHATMDARIVDGRPSGDSRAGRHLFGNLKQTGIQVLDAGSSDWVVFPRGRAYPADEAYFLHFIINTMHGALRHAPELDPQRFDAWIAARHAQIDAGELVYIAHQLDFLGRYTG
ncbi:MAG: class I SAM-dependent methyltransferase [Caldilineaceae bacterium]|nr:class I SAM-dependent methyltransferase [Caldilineaceae bacterium]